jgi:hypothetical protein
MRRNRWLRQYWLVWIRASLHDYTVGIRLAPVRHRFRTSDPTPAVSAMASAPQNVTRIAPHIPPRRPCAQLARPEERGTAAKFRRQGNQDPRRRHRSDKESDGCSNSEAPSQGRRSLTRMRAENSEIPSSSRACAPIASWTISCLATCFASEGLARDRRRLT